MANRSTTAKLTRDNLTVQQHETDCPILPVPQLQQLQQFKPEAVDWVMEQTKKEAEFRRAEGKRVNTFVFIERLVGQIFALLIGLAGILGGAYVAIKGQPAAGATIASLSIGGLAAVFLTGRKGNESKKVK
jgi:uncharacterized membrane protein